jgi:hypothetical protein
MISLNAEKITMNLQHLTSTNTDLLEEHSQSIIGQTDDSFIKF